MSEQEPNWERTVPRDQSWGGCRACRHLQPGEWCDAYPDGIPQIIFDGQVDHLIVRPHQVGPAVFEVNEHPTGLALLRIRGGVKQGEAWALAAVTRSPALRAALEAAPAPSAPVR